MSSIATLSRHHCAVCNAESLYSGSKCVHCGTERRVAARGEFHPVLDSRFAVTGGKGHCGSPSSKSRRKAPAKSGMPAHVAAEGGSR